VASPHSAASFSRARSVFWAFEPQTRHLGAGGQQRARHAQADATVAAGDDRAAAPLESKGRYMPCSPSATAC